MPNVIYGRGISSLLSIESKDELCRGTIIAVHHEVLAKRLFSLSTAPPAEFITFLLLLVLRTYYSWYLERFWALYTQVGLNPKLPRKVRYIDVYFGVVRLARQPEETVGSINHISRDRWLFAALLVASFPRACLARVIPDPVLERPEKNRDSSRGSHARE